MFSTERDSRTSSNGRRFAAVASIAAATVVGTAVGSVPANALESAPPSVIQPSATLATNHSSIAPGQPVTLTVTEHDPAGKAVPGALANLYELNGSTWAVIGQEHLSTAGTGTFTIRPGATHEFQVDLQPVASGGKSYNWVHSPRVTVKTDIGPSIVATAAAEKGRPYVYGAAGPHSFDCSGLVKYVFGRFGIDLPHHADAQKNYGSRVSEPYARPGDLVFVMDGSYATHVGIYAGNGDWWEAPSAGETVRLVKIWSTSVEYRHVR